MGPSPRFGLPQRFVPLAVVRAKIKLTVWMMIVTPAAREEFGMPRKRTLNRKDYIGDFEEEGEAKKEEEEAEEEEEADEADEEEGADAEAEDEGDDEEAPKPVKKPKKK